MSAFIQSKGRDTWLALGLFAVLLVVMVAAAIYQTQQQIDKPTLASFSSDPDGGRALRLWLEELEYIHRDIILSEFAVPRGTNVVLMLEPFPGITEDEWQTLDEWVEEGGTLILAGESWGAYQAIRHYRFNLTYLETLVITQTAQTPLLVSPPLVAPVPGATVNYLETERLDYVTHLAVGGRPVLVSFDRGRGRVFISATAYPFSNAGLKQAGNDRLVLNLISAAGRAGPVWFDEWHHGQRAQQEPVGPWNWLRRTAAGRSLLYSAAIVFMALVLGGRRFGRPVPLAKDVARRTPLEYITAIANLNRRAGHRQAVMQHNYQRLKRELGRRYRLSPALLDDAYVKQLAAYRPDLDTAGLARLLARLNQRKVSENEMVETAAEVARWLEES
jgi:hypothetical protein